MRTKELQAKIDKAIAIILDDIKAPADDECVSELQVNNFASAVSTLVHARGQLEAQNDVTENER